MSSCYIFFALVGDDGGIDCILFVLSVPPLFQHFFMHLYCHPKFRNLCSTREKYSFWSELRKKAQQSIGAKVGARVTFVVSVTYERR